MPVNVRNAEMVAMLAGDFQARYEPQFAWKSACSAFLAPIGVRGFWPTSSFDENGDLIDLSGQGNDLTLNGNPLYRMDGLAPYVVLDGTGDYFSNGGGVGSWCDILGTEAYVANPRLGVTVAGWFRFTNAAGAAEYMISKWDTGGNERSYVLYRQIGGTIRFAVSVDGTAIVGIATTGTPAADEWFFAAGRFDANAQELDVWYNDEVSNLAVGVPVSVRSNATDFILGGRHGGAGLMTGRLSLCALYATNLPDAIIGQLFQQTRAMFGV